MVSFALFLRIIDIVLGGGGFFLRGPPVGGLLFSQPPRLVRFLPSFGLRFGPRSVLSELVWHLHEGRTPKRLVCSAPIRVPTASSRGGRTPTVVVRSAPNPHRPGTSWRSSFPLSPPARPSSTRRKAPLCSGSFMCDVTIRFPWKRQISEGGIPSFSAMSDLISLPRVALGGIVTFRYGLPMKEIHISFSERSCSIEGSVADPSVGDWGSHWWEFRFCSG